MVGVAGFLADWLAAVAAIATTIIALGVIAKSRLGGSLRWVWRRLVGEPLEMFFRHNVNEVVTPQIDVLRAENTEQHGIAATDRRQMEATVLARLDDLDALNRREHEMLHQSVKSVAADLADHVAWEMGAKYPPVPPDHIP
jgi:hypothetical protein